MIGVLSEKKKNFGITRSRNLGECSLTTSPVAGSLKLPDESTALVLLTACAGESPLEIVIGFVDAAEWRAAQQYQTAIPTPRSRRIFAPTHDAHAEWLSQIHQALAARDRCAGAGGGAAPPRAPVLLHGDATISDAAVSKTADTHSGVDNRAYVSDDTVATGASHVLDFPDVPVAPPSWPSTSEAVPSTASKDGHESQTPDLQQLQQRLAALNPASWTAIQLRKQEQKQKQQQQQQQHGQRRTLHGEAADMTSYVSAGLMSDSSDASEAAKIAQQAAAETAHNDFVYATGGVSTRPTMTATAAIYGTDQETDDAVENLLQQTRGEIDAERVMRGRPGLGTGMDGYSDDDNIYGANDTSDDGLDLDGQENESEDDAAIVARTETLLQQSNKMLQQREQQ